MTLQAHGKCVPSEDMHAHVHTLKRAQLRHLHTPVPITRSLLRAQTPPASRFHPRPGTPWAEARRGKGTSMPGRCQPCFAPSKSPASSGQPSPVPCRSSALHPSSHPNLCSAPATWQRWKPPNNPNPALRISTVAQHRVQHLQRRVRGGPATLVAPQPSPTLAASRDPGDTLAFTVTAP